MKTFKRTPFNFLKNLLYAIFAPVGVFVIAAIVEGFLSVDRVMYFFIVVGIAALIFLFMLYSVLFSEKIFVEVDEKELRYYKRGKLRETYAFSTYRFGYHTISSSGTTDTIRLKILNIENGNEESLDLQPLGSRQFHKLFAILEENTKENEIPTLEVKKKE